MNNKEKDRKPSKLILEDEGIVLLMGTIDEDIIENTIRRLMAISFANPKDDITLIIDSWGGELPSAMHLIDVMRMLPNKIITVGLGKISSCGLLIFMSGDERRVSYNCSILSHQYSWGNRGKMHELKGRRVEEDLTERRLIEHYVKCTGKSKKYIEQHLLSATDTWLTGKEAIKHGLADKIINTLDIAKKK